jgi:phenylpyruvate tautomerase PptA (4-oxalocrotonate tautomerase family)
MPFARLTLAPVSTQDQVYRLHADLTDLIAKVLRKRHDLTSVLVETSVPRAWSINAVNRPTLGTPDRRAKGTPCRAQRLALAGRNWLGLCSPASADRRYVFIKRGS